MKKSVKKLDVKKFEILSQDGKILKGGFSTAIYGAGAKEGLGLGEQDPIQPINNCHGANCAAFCSGTGK